MLPSFNITADAAYDTYDTMVIFSSDVRGEYPTTEVFNGPRTPTFTDNSAIAAPGLRRYRVQLRDDSGNWIEGSPFDVPVRADWGPYTLAMADTMSVLGSPIVKGNCHFGTMAPDAGVALPTNGSFTDAQWSAIIKGAPGNTDVNTDSNVNRDMRYKDVMYRGRILRVATNLQYSLFVGNLNGEWAATRAQNLYKYLETNPADAKVILDGHAWQLKMMSNAMFLDIGLSLALNPIGPACVVLGLPNLGGRHLVGNADPAETMADLTTNNVVLTTTTLRGQTSSSNAHNAYMYFEYMGIA